MNLGDWVTVTHYYRKVERHGVMCWETKAFPQPCRGVWIGSRDVVHNAKALWDGFGLRPLGGNTLTVQVVAIRESHAPHWIPAEFMTELKA